MTDTTAPGAINPDATTAEPEGVRPLTAPVRTYAMSLLLGIYTINFLDRQVVNILAEPIKQDLGLADWQLGLMSGLAFALFYTVLGIPIARIAERGNRPLIIGIAVAVWSGFTALCGLAQNFVQLILFRIGVGVGEAGCTPPAHSLISDYVPKEQRSTALAFYSMGTPIGGLMGLILGGLVADAYGWRIAFLVAGVPGILFALLAIFTLPEPRKELARRTANIQANSATFGETMAFLRGQKTFLYISFAAAVKAFIGYGHAPFTASFFLRNYPDQVQSLASTVGATVGYNLQSIGFLGLALGLMSGIAGAMGSWLAAGEAAHPFTIDDDLELQAADGSRASIRHTRHAPEHSQLRRYLSGGFVVTRLGLTWNGRVSFVLTDGLALNRVELLDVDEDRPSEDETDAVARLDADFLLMTGELSTLLKELVDALGGEAARAEAA